jgi:hypothetical protein
MSEIHQGYSLQADAQQAGYEADAILEGAWALRVSTGVCKAERTQLFDCGVRRRFDFGHDVSPSARLGD